MQLEINNDIYQSIKNKLITSYVKWSKKQQKYVDLTDKEKSGLSLEILNYKDTKLLDFLATSNQKWINEIPTLKSISEKNSFTHIALLEESKYFFKKLGNASKQEAINYSIFVYGKNLRNEEKPKEIYGFGTLCNNREYVELLINVSHPLSQQDRIIREDGIIGASGSNIRNAMIKYAFEELKSNNVRTYVISKKAQKTLEQELGFIPYTSKINQRNLCK